LNILLVTVVTGEPPDRLRSEIPLNLSIRSKVNEDFKAIKCKELDDEMFNVIALLWQTNATTRTTVIELHLPASRSRLNSVCGL